MAIIPKIVTDIRANTTTAVNKQPASGKTWVFSKLTYGFSVAINCEIKVNRYDGTTSDTEAEFTAAGAHAGTPWLVVNTSTDNHPGAGVIPFHLAPPGSHFGGEAAALGPFTNGSYIRIVPAGTCGSGSRWALGWIGIEEG
jgi:hypothetical protein